MSHNDHTAPALLQAGITPLPDVYIDIIQAGRELSDEQQAACAVEVAQRAAAIKQFNIERGIGITIGTPRRPTGVKEIARTNGRRYGHLYQD